jgi:hypothetical protein
MLNDICIANKQNPLSMSSNMATVTELAHHLYETPKRTDYFAQVPFESATFQDTASQLFNTFIPAELRNCKDFNEFSRQCKELLMCKSVQWQN